MLTTILHLFAAPGACSTTTFFGIPPWYKYLDAAGKIGAGCQIKKLDLPADLTLVALGFLEILLRIAGIMAVAFVVWGGIQYVTSQGEPARTKAAQGTIINALIGLAVTVIAVALVSFIGNAVGK